MNRGKNLNWVTLGCILAPIRLVRVTITCSLCTILGGCPSLPSCCDGKQNAASTPASSGQDSRAAPAAEDGSATSGNNAAFSGLPLPGADEDWADRLAAEAIGWEEVEEGGDEEGGDAERIAQLRAFFLANPRYRDPEQQGALAAMACAFGIEGAHERLQQPQVREPLEIEVGADWRVVVAHADIWCPSDDWTWFSDEVSKVVEGHGFVTAHGGPSNDRVVLRRDGAVVAEHPLEGQGYLLLAAGREPAEVGHDVVDGVLGAIGAHFGLALAP